MIFLMTGDEMPKQNTNTMKRYIEMKSAMLLPKWYCAGAA